MASPRDVLKMVSPLKDRAHLWSKTSLRLSATHQACWPPSWPPIYQKTARRATFGARCFMDSISGAYHSWNRRSETSMLVIRVSHFSLGGLFVRPGGDDVRRSNEMLEAAKMEKSARSKRLEQKPQRAPACTLPCDPKML